MKPPQLQSPEPEWKNLLPKSDVGSEEKIVGICVTVLIVGGLIFGLLFSVFKCFHRRSILPPPPPPPSHQSPSDRSSHGHKLGTLPTFVYGQSFSVSCSYSKSPSSSPDSEVKCAICLTEFFYGEEVRVLPRCKHIYHKGCIDKWLLKSWHCPICRDFSIELEDGAYKEPLPRSRC